MPEPIHDADLKKSHTGTYVTMAVMIVAAVGMGLAAVVIQLQNRRTMDMLVHKSWMATDDVRVDLHTSDPLALTAWEQVALIEEMKGKLNTYLMRKHTGKLEDDPEAAKQTPRTVVDETARALEIERAGNVKYTGVRTTSIRLGADRWRETTFEFEFKKLSRLQVVALGLALEDRFPFLTLRDLTMERKADDPNDPTHHDWEVKMTVVWYDKEEARPSPTASAD